MDQAEFDRVAATFAAFHAEVVPLFRYSYPLESAASRLQGFRHRVDSKDYVHGLLSLLLVAAQV